MEVLAEGLGLRPASVYDFSPNFFNAQPSV
jgi:hypothetical protein